MSKFKEILDAAREREPEPDNNIQPEIDMQAIETKSVEPAPKQKLGRPKGKRSDPDYEQVTAYVKKETYTATKIALLSEGNKQEFSQLVQELLEQWLKSRSY